LTVARQLAGGCLGQAANTGGLVETTKLIGSCQAKVISSGLLRATKVLAGIDAPRAASTGNLVVTRALAANCAVKAGCGGLLRATKPLAGTDTAHTASTGTVSLIRELNGSVSGRGSSSGVLIVVHKLAATCLVLAANTGNLHIITFLPAQECLVRAAISGTLQATKPLSGACQSAAVSTGLLRARKAMASFSVVYANMNGTLSMANACASVGEIYANARGNLVATATGRNEIEMTIFTQQFVNYWLPLNPAILVKYINRNFVEPTVGLWVEFGMDSGVVVDVAIGGTVARGSGEVWLKIFVSENQGTLAVRQLADQFADVFSRKNFPYPGGNIWTRRPFVKRQNMSNGWLMWTSTIPFKHDEFMQPVSAIP